MYNYRSKKKVNIYKENWNKDVDCNTLDIPGHPCGLLEAKPLEDPAESTDRLFDQAAAKINRKPDNPPISQQTIYS